MLIYLWKCWWITDNIFTLFTTFGTSVLETKNSYDIQIFAVQHYFILWLPVTFTHFLLHWPPFFSKYLLTFYITFTSSLEPTIQWIHNASLNEGRVIFFCVRQLPLEFTANRFYLFNFYRFPALPFQQSLLCLDLKVFLSSHKIYSIHVIK